MASLFQHLWVLLWKNWLSVKRQPLWSLILISWPVFSFILVAIIRIKFPPESQPNCYLAPRNLPSTGFFPFLQTALCSSDAICKSTPYTPEDLLPKLNGISPISKKWRRSAPLEDSNPSSQSADVPKRRNGSLELIDATGHMENMVGNISSAARIHLLKKILSLKEMPRQNFSLTSLKMELCEVMTTNVPSHSLLWEVLGTNVYQTFCFKNVSLVESFFQEFRHQVPKLQYDPQYQVAFVKEAISFLSLISQLQNETSIWHTLLMVPDITQGVINVKDMVAALQNPSRTTTNMEKGFSSVVKHSRFKNIQNLIGSLLSTLQCSKQDKNHSIMNDICKFALYWKNNHTLFADMKDDLRKISADFMDEDWIVVMNRLSNNSERMKKSVQLFKGLQEKFKNMQLLKQCENRTILLRLAEILQQETESGRDNKLKDLLNEEAIHRVCNLTSLLLQNGFSALPSANIMSYLKESHIFVRTLVDLIFLNKTNPKAAKAWQTIEMLTSYKFPPMSEEMEKYIISVQEVPSLFTNSLLRPTTVENFPEKLLTLQNIVGIIANVNQTRNYLLISFFTDMMQKIQDSIRESQWNEFNTYWHIGEKLRSAKWNDTDIFIYGQILDIFHNSLHSHRNGSKRPLKRELGQLTQYVTQLLEKYGDGSFSGANVTVVLDAILKTLRVLEDLEEKYISELVSINPLMNMDNENVQNLFELFKEGMDILSDPRLTEASNVNKIDALLSFSHLLLLQEFYWSPRWRNSSAEAKALEFLYLTLGPFLREDVPPSDRLPNCTIKDLHLLALEVWLNNATLKDTLRESNCSFLFTSVDLKSQTPHHHTFTELFQLAARNLKSMPAFDTLHESHDNQTESFSGLFLCLVQSLQLSSGFLSKLNSFHNYKNPWIQKMHKTLTVISNELSQNNMTCQVPLFGSTDVRNDSSALYILTHFLLNETEANAQNISGSPSAWIQPLRSFIFLHRESRMNVSASRISEVSENAIEPSEWKNFSMVLDKVAEILSSGQNVTSSKQYVQLLEMTRKALVLVTQLAPNETDTYLFLKTLHWAMNPSYLEEVPGLLSSNLTSDMDYKIYFEKLFYTFSPPIDVLTKSLFYMTSRWEETKEAFKVIRLVWKNLFFNKTNFKLARLWGAIKKVVASSTPLLPEGILGDFNSTQQVPLPFLNFRVQSRTTRNILEHLSGLPKDYHKTEDVNRTDNDSLSAYLSRIRQIIHNATSKTQWNESSVVSHVHEPPSFLKLNGTKLFTFLSESDILPKLLSVWVHDLSSDFSLEREKLSGVLYYLLQEYVEEPSENHTSDTVNILVRNLENLEPRFNISKLKTAPPLPDSLKKMSERVGGMWIQGATILSRHRLEGETDQERIATLYNYSRFLYHQESEFLLGLNSSVERQIMDVLHLSLSPFLDTSDHIAGRAQNCSIQDVIHVILQALFKNVTIQVALKQSPCESLFTFRDTGNRALSHQTFTDWFQSSIREIGKTTELSDLYQKNPEHFSNALLCMIQSVHFSSALLSKIDIPFSFQHPWLHRMYKTLQIVCKELPPNNATCPIPSFGDINMMVDDSPLSIIPLFTNEVQSFGKYFTDTLADWDILSVLFRFLRDNFHTNETVQMDKEALFSQAGWNALAEVWNMVSKWNFTENKYTELSTKLVERALSHNMTTPEILDASVHIFKNVVALDSLKELKAGFDKKNILERSGFTYGFDHMMYPFAVAAETLLEKALLSNDWEEMQSLNSVVARFLFSEFENIFIAMSPDNGFRAYLACIMNATEELNGGLSEHSTLPPNIAELERVLLTPKAAYKNYSSIPDILILKLIHLRNLTSLLCDRESIRSLRQVCQLPDISFVELCDQSKFHKKLLHAVELSGHAVTSSINPRSLSEEIREIVIGDPRNIQQQINWLQENVPQLKYLQDIPKYIASLNSIVNITKNTTYSRKQDVLMDLFRNVDDLRKDLRNLIGMSPESIRALMEMPLPENRTQLIFQALQLESCNTDVNDTKLELITEQFCNLSLAERAHKSYLLGVTFLHYLDVYNFMYKVLLPKEIQTSLDKVLGLLKELEGFKKQITSDIRPLLDAIHSLKKLRQSRNAPLSKALIQTNNLTIDGGTFKTISKALCNQELTPLFFESLLPDFEEQNVHHSFMQEEHVQHIMKKYGIPQDSSPFCLSLFLDLVKTPTGALIWSFLKPMLLGRILYTPDTPETQAIMEKSNSTLKLMDSLMQKSQEWLDSSPLLMNSLTMLNETIPIVKNTLRNPFVQVFIKLMVKLDAVDLLNQIDQLDDIRLELENNAEIIDQLSTLAGLAVNVSSCVLFDRIQPHKTVEDLERVAKDLFLRNELFGSVIFHLPSVRKRGERATPAVLSLPPVVNYTIRMSSKISQTTRRIREKIWTVGPHNSASQSQIYSRAFIYIQDSIDRAIIELQTGKSVEDIAVQVQATPYPCYNKDMFLTSVTYSLPFTLMAAWVLFIAAFVRKLVQEKDLRLYEYMKMMGVNSSSHFFAWFIECATFLLITVTFLIVVLKFGQILPKINVVILFLYLMDYSLSIIAMCYLISVFFNNTNIAALVGCLVYILTFFPFIVLLVVENHMSFSVKSLLSLLSPTAFSYASQYIARYEEQGIGLQWDNMYISPMSGDNTNFGWMCWLILIDSVIYFILGWYIRNVFPGKYGMAAPWYFPLLPSYWAERYGYSPVWSEKIKGYLFTNFFLTRQPSFHEKMYVQSALPSNLEPEPTNLKVGVSLHGITKIYESKAAVQNLSLNFYEGNITSLLGHNGAGKTTTISILTGLFPASSGTIFVYGKDIRNDQDIIRKNMGICMQHNVLFNYLTTKEHLFLYGYIKVPHWSKQELREEVERTLKETGLYSHRHKMAGSLSGGMKRKLSISIALLGGSKVVILDEPTTGVDPCSRRGIWEIISKNRKGRTIILSTHHLDEAEVLSDRIAFLEHGGLKCCGSPFYLKETFGGGYHLTLTKKKSPALTVAEGCETSAVTAMIQSHLPEACLKEDIGGELVYVLPQFNSKTSPAYQSLLRALDNGLEDLHIGCYGISDSTVEEVFLNLTKDLTKDRETDAEWSKDISSCSMENDDLSVSSDNFAEKDDQVLFRMRKPNNISLLLRKAGALFVKRFHHTRRNVKGFIAQVILPVLFVVAAMGLGTLRTKVAEYPALQLSPSLYGSRGQADFFGNYNETTSALVSALLSFPGADNVCLNKSNLACFKEDVPEEWVFSGNQSAQYSACNCSDIRQTCPKIDFSPPHKKTFFSRTIYNLTGHDVETYLLVTAKDFVQKRYGGWSFGLPLTSDLQFDVTPVPANRTITKVWYNPEGYHSLPAYLNSLNNFILRANLPKEKSAEYGISVVAHPYPGGESQEQAMLSSLLDIIVSMSVLIGYSITTASFVLYVVKEHQTKAKQLQHISGIGVRTYWVTNFLYDLVYFLVPVTLSVGVISAFQIPAFFNDNNLLAVFLLLFLFGYATFSWMYLLAGIFKETGMAFIVYVCINLFFGVNTIITHSIVFLLSQEKATDQGLHDLAETLRHVFLIFPQFCFGYGLIEMSQHQALMGFLKAYGVDYPNKTFELDRISSKLLGMFIQGTIFFSIRLLVDDGTFQKVWYKMLEFLFDKVHGKPPLQPESFDEQEDKDVRAEQERVTLGLGDYDMLQLQNLTKVYHLPHRRIVAVKNISVGIPAGECFGLLGVNGAGKTTIFKMLTGDIGPSCGRLLVRDETGSLKDIDDEHWSLFGYCPQEDALDDLLTVEEHMYYYARLHGIREKDIKGIVLQLLYRLNLMPYKHRTTSTCSYGTNRKLSTALALLGKPSILLLDEPSSGMDPNAKRHLWKIITEEVQKQCSVILTSHSMEECEALCTRLAIMVNGRFQCLGSLQHIKSRFGRGFTVKMHLNNDTSSVEKLTQFLQSNFPNTHLKDHQLNMVEYHVPVSAGGVANIFQLLESNKATFNIRHFSVCQTTLEEVFINFAKAQTGSDLSDGSSDLSSDSLDSSSQDSNVTAIY